MQDCLELVLLGLMYLEGGSFSAFAFGNFLLAFLKGCANGKKRLLFLYTTLSKAETNSPADERMQVETNPEINIHVQKTQV